MYRMNEIDCELIKNGSLYQLPALYNVLHLRNANEDMTLKTNVQ